MSLWQQLVQTIDFSKVDIQAQQHVLDLGCGEGRHTIATHYFFPQAKVVGADLSLKDLKVARTCLKEWAPQENRKTVSGGSVCFMCVNGFHLPFATDTFDHIIFSEVMEHIPDYRMFFKELTRVLKPEGKIYLSVPRAWPERICWKLSESYHKVEGGHVHIFKANHVHALLQDFGFSITHSYAAHALHTPYWWLRCLFWERGDQFLPVRLYHQFLVWDLMEKPFFTRMIDQLLNPIMGKSIVFHATKNRKHDSKK